MKSSFEIIRLEEFAFQKAADKNLNIKFSYIRKGEVSFKVLINVEKGKDFEFYLMRNYKINST